MAVVRRPPGPDRLELRVVLRDARTDLEGLRDRVVGEVFDLCHFLSGDRQAFQVVPVSQLEINPRTHKTLLVVWEE